MGYSKRFFKTAGVYFLGNAFTKIISFLLLPLYTSRISPDDFGVYGLAITLINTMVPVLFFSIWDGVFRFAFDVKDNNRQAVFANGFLMALFGALLYTLSFCIFRYFVQFEHTGLILLYSLSMAGQYFYTILARGNRNNTLFVISGCANSLLSFILNVVLIVGFKMGVESLYISYIVGVILQIAVIEVKIHFLSGFSLKQYNFELAFSMLRFSVPVAISSASRWLLNGLTQVFIIGQLGAYSNGLYTVVMKFASILILIIGVFQFAWYELAYDLANHENRKSYYCRSISVILKLSLAGLSLLLIVVKLVYPVFINGQYAEGLWIVPPLLFGTMANAYAGFLGTLFMAEKKPLSMSFTTVLAGLVNIVGLLILVPLWGLLGATLSLSLSFAFYALIRLILLARKQSVMPEISTVPGLIIVGISCVLFYLLQTSQATILALLVLMIIVFWYLKKELRFLGETFSKKGKRGH
ncbi:MAG TPA: oligosaccharide flippase family protein [Clostridiales bacterium]|nr:oligosaccharide flippase family protein [Clostridiales bacterium]